MNFASDRAGRRRNRLAPEQVVAKLREAERLQGRATTIPPLAKRLGIAEAPDRSRRPDRSFSRQRSGLENRQRGLPSFVGSNPTPAACRAEFGVVDPFAGVRPSGAESVGVRRSSPPLQMGGARVGQTQTAVTAPVHRTSARGARDCRPRVGAPWSVRADIVAAMPTRGSYPSQLSPARRRPCTYIERSGSENRDL